MLAEYRDHSADRSFDKTYLAVKSSFQAPDRASRIRDYKIFTCSKLVLADKNIKLLEIAGSSPGFDPPARVEAICGNIGTPTAVAMMSARAIMLLPVAIRDKAGADRAKPQNLFTLIAHELQIIVFDSI